MANPAMIPRNIERLGQTIGRRATSRSEVEHALRACGLSPHHNELWRAAWRIAVREMARREAARNQEKEEDVEFVSLLVYSLQDDLEAEWRCPMRREFIGASPLNDDWHPHE